MMWQEVEALPWVLVMSTGRELVGFCQICRVYGHAGASEEALEDFIDSHAEHESRSPTHYGLGDAITQVSRSLGFQHCSPCEARRVALNGLVPRVPFLRR